MKRKKSKWPLWYNGYYFWLRPIKCIKNWFWNLKCFFRRGRMGWAPSDVWDLDMYLGKIMPEMLRYLATNHTAFPYSYKGFTKDEEASLAWENDLYDIAQKIEYAAADRDEFNPYTKQYYEYLENKNSKPITEKQQDLINKFYDEDKKIYFRQTVSIKDALTWLGEHWYEIWD